MKYEIQITNTNGMKKTKTQRGFVSYSFKDAGGIECSIQKSSWAEKDAIWLGAKKIGLKEFIAYRQPTAWMDREDVDEFSHAHHFIANNRMHLTREQVAKMLPILQKFVETGEIS